MEAGRRVSLLLGIFFLGLWVGTETARASKAHHKINDQVVVYVGHDENGLVEIDIKSPATNDEWKFVARATYVTDYPIRDGGGQTVLLPSTLADGTVGTFFVTGTGYSAFVPIPYNAENLDFHWSTRQGVNSSGATDTFFLISVKHATEQGLYLSRFSDGKTIRLDKYFHELANETWHHVHLLSDGTLWLPGSGATFDTFTFDREEPVTGRLKAVTVDEVEKFRKILGGSGREIGTTGFAYEPGKDASVIWHPLWVKLGPGLLDREGGGLAGLINNLRRLAWIMENSPEDRGAAEAAFRLFVGEESLRRTLGHSDSSKKLTPEDYRRYILLKKTASEERPPTPEPADWWVTRTRLWKVLQECSTTPEKFETLADYLGSKEPSTKNAALAAARVLLGGEKGIYLYSGGENGGGLADENYIVAAKARARLSRVVAAELALDQWLTERSPHPSDWWANIANLASLHLDGIVTDAAKSLIERNLGGRRGLAEFLGKKAGAELTDADYVAAARNMSKQLFVEDFMKVCGKVLGESGGDTPRPSVN